MPRSKKPENRRLIREWTSAAMALLIGQGQRPIRCGRRGELVAAAKAELEKLG